VSVTSASFRFATGVTWCDVSNDIVNFSRILSQTVPTVGLTRDSRTLKFIKVYQNSKYFVSINVCGE